MNAAPLNEPKPEQSVRRVLYGVAAVVIGIASLLGVIYSPKSFRGWLGLAWAATLVYQAFTCKPSPNIVYHAPKWWVALVLAVCVAPPVVLLFVCVLREWHDWMGPALAYFFLSSIIGPVLLLRRYVVQPKEDGQGELEQAQDDFKKRRSAPRTRSCWP